MNQKDFHAQVFLQPGKARLALLASASAQTFADVFWKTTENESEIAIMLLNLLSRLQEEKKYDQIFELLRILHSAFRVHFGPELMALRDDPTALKCFLDCFLRDFFEIIDDDAAGIG